MDTTRFDALTRVLGRRGLVTFALAAVTGGLTAFPADAGGPTPVPCTEKGSGQRCRKSGQCCSGQCKKKKGKKKGKCRCSQLRARCQVNSDCCGHVAIQDETPHCVQIGTDPTAVCCIRGGRPCTNDADCCGTGAFCNDITRKCDT